MNINARIAYIVPGDEHAQYQIKQLIKEVKYSEISSWLNAYKQCTGIESDPFIEAMAATLREYGPTNALTGWDYLAAEHDKSVLTKKESWVYERKPRSNE